MNDSPPTLLLVEDDRAVRTFLADNLCADGFDPECAPTVARAWRLLCTRRFDAVLLDVGLPDGSGLSLLDRIRAADPLSGPVDPALPVIVLSGRADEHDRVRAFEHDADDFLAKPFAYAEVRHRLRALLRRVRTPSRSSTLRAGSLRVDTVARVVHLDGRPVSLAHKEFLLLRTLAGEPTRVFTKDELLHAVWGFRARGSTRTLDAHACRLRRKLGVSGQRYVVNVWGVGYRLLEAVAAEVAA